MKPLPLTVFLIVIGVLIGGLIITGNSENTDPVTEYVPVDEEMTPIKCIDIAPVEDVPCDGRNDAIVWEIIPADSKCSRGLSLSMPHKSEGSTVSFISSRLPMMKLQKLL